MADLYPNMEGSKKQRVQNIIEARKARGALSTYSKGLEPQIIDPVVDLLTALMHLCDMDGLEFDEQLRMAREHYEEETDGEDEE